MRCISNIFLFLAGFVIISKACDPYVACTKERDTIVQFDDNIPLEERTRNAYRNWFIRPSLLPFNAILAFKNFSSNFTSVIVLAQHSTGQKTTKYYSGHLGNFELMLEDVFIIIITIPIIHRLTAEFTVNYITGCSILTSAQGNINQAQIGSVDQENSNCWLIHPSDSADRKSIYFNVQNVSLGQDFELNILDLHTSKFIIQTSNRNEGIVVAESYDHSYQQSILIDLQCMGPNCETDAVSANAVNTFFIDYYSMSSRDNNCIQRSQSCYANTNAPEKSCNVVCPALTLMILDEYSKYGKDGNLNIPVVRSGRTKCPLPPQYCGCPKIVKKTLFCIPQVKCYRMKRCTYACIYHKITTCARLTVLDSVTLL